jgi:hypothetical protein
MLLTTTNRFLFTEPSSTADTKHPVLFNQRLLSSTPVDTPMKKTLVERNGVLYLNGSTDTQILNATDDALALRPPYPPRPPGPQLISGQIQFIPNPVQFRSPFQDPSLRFSGMGEQNRFAAPRPTNVKPLHDAYSLYSSTSSERAPAGAPRGQLYDNYGVSDGVNDPHSVVCTQPGVPSDRQLSGNGPPCCEYSSSSSQDAHNAAIPGYIFSNGGNTATAGNFILTTSGTGSGSQLLSSEGVKSMASCTRGTRDCEKPLYSTPAVDTSLNHLLSSGGSILHSSNSLTLQDFQNGPSTCCCRGTGTSFPAGNSIYTMSGVGTASGRQVSAHSNAIQRDRANQAHVKRVPSKSATVASGRMTVSNNEQKVTTDAAASYRPSRQTRRSDQGKCKTSGETVDAAQLISLLKQLREVIVANRESEIVQLLNDICDAARTAPITSTCEPTALLGFKPATGGVDIETSLQTLRSENAHLQR